MTIETEKLFFPMPDVGPCVYRIGYRIPFTRWHVYLRVSRNKWRAKVRAFVNANTDMHDIELMCVFGTRLVNGNRVFCVHRK